MEEWSIGVVVLKTARFVRRGKLSYLLVVARPSSTPPEYDAPRGSFARP